MVFSSIVFLFAFLPATILVYHLLPWKLKNIVLLLASLFFYAWGEGRYVLIMLASILVNYVAGILIHREHRQYIRRLILAFAIGLNVAGLIYFKYANFAVDNLGGFFHGALTLRDIHLPIGISFFTFQAISYIVDVFRKEAPVQKNPLNLGLYVSLFPQLIAGPIVRFHDVAKQILARTHSIKKFSNGIHRFITGLAKKVLIANTLGQVADVAFQSPGELSVFAAWLGVICYAFQIYFDFSGYSDMAIGLGYMFGFSFLENFNYPYISGSIREFWQRWHISLSTWFRDYLYIPLGGNQYGKGRTLGNLLIIFGICGFWHGASWNFFIWGMLHGTYLIVERICGNDLITKVPILLRRVYVWFAVLVAWVFFRAETLPNAIDYLGAMFGISGNSVTLQFLHQRGSLSVEVLISLLVALGLAFRLYPKLMTRGRSWLEKSSRGGVARPMIVFAHSSFMLAIFMISLTYVAAGTHNPFIYFRF